MVNRRHSEVRGLSTKQDAALWRPSCFDTSRRIRVRTHLSKPLPLSLSRALYSSDPLHWAPDGYRGGGGGCTGIVSPPLEFPKLPHASRMRRSEAERYANQVATAESSNSSQHPLVQTLAQKLWTHSKCHRNLHCPADTPKLRQGKLSSPSFKTELSHEGIPRPTSPLPLWYAAAPGVEVCGPTHLQGTGPPRAGNRPQNSGQ